MRPADDQPAHRDPPSVRAAHVMGRVCRCDVDAEDAAERGGPREKQSVGLLPGVEIAIDQFVERVLAMK
jgi:hypothetical protein